MDNTGITAEQLKFIRDECKITGNTALVPFISDEMIELMGKLGVTTIHSR